MAFVNYKDILEATNHGLDIIAMYYPDAPNGLRRRDRKFKIRDERTASASIRLKDDSYHVTDFGGDQKERNAINVCMYETGKTFKEAINYLAGVFKVNGATVTWQEIKPEWSTRPISEGESHKDYRIVEKDFTDNELKRLGKCVSEEHCKEFNLISTKSFEYVKENEVSITSSTDEYPIYAFREKEWSKIYQPLSYNKQFRFRFVGKKPERFIYGLELLKKQYLKNVKNQEEEQYDDEDDENKKKKDPRVDYVFIVSGGSDGLNVRSFGYFPVWFNSESEILTYEEYKLLTKYAREIIYIPDLDATGIKQGKEIALTYLDIKILLLPNYLKNRRDKRGNTCKDFKDFVDHFYDKTQHKKFNNRLTKLIENALPAQFWELTYTKNTSKYVFRPTQFYNFLKINGFGRVKDEQTKDGYHLVHVDGNVVSHVQEVEIEAFVHNFLKQRQMPIKLRDLVYSKQLSSKNTLNKLDAFNIEFNSSDQDRQYMFFQNQVLSITGKEIKLHKRGEVSRFIWENKMLEHNIHLEESHFNISKDISENLDIKILKKDNMFLNYLINTSRIHWRKELEDNLKGKKTNEIEKYKQDNKFEIAGDNLSEDEKHEQKLHLINKIYALGYMFHTYKSPQKPWAVYAMDNKIADLSESHGGSGKSVYLKAIQHVLKQNHYINGRDSKKTQDDFIYHGVTEHTDYLMVDDCHRHMDYGFFFNAITGDLDVNNKNGLRFVIPFNKVPKLAFASNYPPNKLDPSLARRLLYGVFSDYYHYNKDGEYNETRTVGDDFEGKALFKDFTEQQWNHFYNFCAQCIKFYLSHDKKIDPPMNNVTKRNLLLEMGPLFLEWAEVYFTEEEDGPNLNKYIIKDLALKDLIEKTGYKLTPHKFKKSLKAYCQLNEWVFNGPETGEKGGRIMRKHEGTTMEFFYINTTTAKNTEAIKASTGKSEPGNIYEDLPF